MKHLFVPYEIALLAKESGFGEQCFGFFVEKNNKDVKSVRIELSGLNMDDRDEYLISSPIYQQLIDWFRMSHSIYINQSVIIGEDEVTFSVTCNDKNNNLHYADTLGRICKSKLDYYEGLNETLIKAFELIC